MMFQVYRQEKKSPFDKITLFSDNDHKEAVKKLWRYVFARGQFVPVKEGIYMQRKEEKEKKEHEEMKEKEETMKKEKELKLKEIKHQTLYHYLMYTRQEIELIYSNKCIDYKNDKQPLVIGRSLLKLSREDIELLLR